jgi:hypothetical protein
VEWSRRAGGDWTAWLPFLDKYRTMIVGCQPRSAVHGRNCAQKAVPPAGSLQRPRADDVVVFLEALRRQLRLLLAHSCDHAAHREWVGNEGQSPNTHRVIRASL